MEPVRTTCTMDCPDSCALDVMVAEGRIARIQGEPSRLMKFLIVPMLALVTTTQAADMAGDFKGPLGLQLYTLRESFKMNVPTTLDKVKELGFTEIEGGGDYGLGIEKFNALLHERGLKMVSAGFGYESLKKDIGAAVRRAQAFGAKFAMCAWIPHKGDFTEADVHR